MTNRPNVLMIMLDALRPDHIGAWGYERTKTPNMDRIAEQGVFFRDIFAPMPSSANARATIHTGRAPHTHSVRLNGRPLPPYETTLAQIFGEEGYVTVSTGRLPAGQEKGFHQINVGGDGGADPLAWVMWDEANLEAEHPAMDDVKGAVGWLMAHEKDEKPFFMWVDIEDIHEPWRPPEPYDTMFDPGYDGKDVSVNPMFSPGLTEREITHSHALYDGIVSHVDSQIRMIFDELERQGILDRTIVVVVSDHGTFMGEHDLWQKCPVLMDPVMRATLIIRYPESIEGGIQVSHLSQLSDLFATVLDLAGIDIPEPAERESRSLLATWQNDEPVRDAVFMEFCFYKGTAAKAVRTDRWLYLYYRSTGDISWGGGEISAKDIFDAKGWPDRMLFDLEADPDLKNNVVDSHPEVERELWEKLINWLIDSENDVPVQLSPTD